MSGHAWMETILLLGVLAVGAVIFYYGHSDFASKRNTRIRKVRAQLHRTPGVHLGPEGTVPFDSLNLPCSWVFQEVRHQVSHLFPRHPDFSKRVLIFGDPQAMQHLFTDAVVRAVSHYPNICIEGWGDQMVVYEVRKRVSPQSIPGFLNEAMWLMQHFRTELPPLQYR